MPSHDDLIEHLVRSSRLSPREASRLVEEVVAYFSEEPAAFVARRHRELRAEGLANAAIYSHLSEELRARPFASPALSERQIRRLIYG